MQLQMHDGPKILQKHKNSCLASKCYKNLQHFEKVIQMHVEDTKNKNFYYYWRPRNRPYDHCQTMWRLKMSNDQVDMRVEMTLKRQFLNS